MARSPHRPHCSHRGPLTRHGSQRRGRPPSHLPPLPPSAAGGADATLSGRVVPHSFPRRRRSLPVGRWLVSLLPRHPTPCLPPRSADLPPFSSLEGARPPPPVSPARSLAACLTAREHEEKYTAASLILKLPLDTHHPYPNPYPLYLGRIWITHLNLDMGRIYMDNVRLWLH